MNICFIVGAVALVTMLIPSLPYKKWNALFLLIAYPLMTFVLLTGGNLDFSSSTILFIIGLLLLSADSSRSRRWSLWLCLRPPRFSR